MYEFMKSMFYGDLTWNEANTLFMCVASLLEWFGCEARDYFVKGYDMTHGYDLAFLGSIVTALVERHFPREYDSYLNYLGWQKRGGYHE